MKIHHKTITRQIDVESYGLMKNISSYLTEKGYDIYDINSKQIKFKYNFWQFGSRVNALNKIDGGEFVIEEGAIKKITFSYYTSATFEILAILVSLCFMIFMNYFFFVLIIFFIMFFFFRLMIAKNIACNIFDYLLQFPNYPKY